MTDKRGGCDAWDTKKHCNVNESMIIWAAAPNSLTLQEAWPFIFAASISGGFRGWISPDPISGNCDPLGVCLGGQRWAGGADGFYREGRWPLAFQSLHINLRVLLRIKNGSTKVKKSWSGKEKQPMNSQKLFRKGPRQLQETLQQKRKASFSNSPHNGEIGGDGCWPPFNQVHSLQGVVRPPSADKLVKAPLCFSSPLWLISPRDLRSSTRVSRFSPSLCVSYASSQAWPV